MSGLRVMHLLHVYNLYIEIFSSEGMKSQHRRPNNGTVVPLLAKGEKLVLHPGAISYHLSEKHTSKECREGDYSQCGVLYDEFDLAQL